MQSEGPAGLRVPRASSPAGQPTKLPNEHCSSELAPTELVNEPPGQGVQAAALAAWRVLEYVLKGQAVHPAEEVAAVALLNVPSGHSWHAARPVLPA